MWSWEIFFKKNKKNSRLLENWEYIVSNPNWCLIFPSLRNGSFKDEKMHFKSEKSGGSNIPPPLLFRRPWDITTYLCTKESCNIHTVVLVPPKHIGHAYFTYASYFSTVSKNFSIPFMGMNPWNFVNCEFMNLWNCELVKLWIINNV